MLKIKKNCKVCIAVQENKRLLERIYNSSAFIPHSKDSLQQIHKDCNGAFTYNAILNHVKRHQHLNAADYANRMLQHKIKKVEDKLIVSRFEAVNAQDAVINIGMEKLEKGEMKITADHLLRAAKDKQDAQAKVKDQQLKLAEMVAFYTSGEDKLGSDRIDDIRVLRIEDYNPAIPVTENPDTGTN